MGAASSSGTRTTALQIAPSERVAPALDVVDVTWQQDARHVVNKIYFLGQIMTLSEALRAFNMQTVDGDARERRLQRCVPLAVQQRVPTSTSFRVCWPLTVKMCSGE